MAGNLGSTAPGALKPLPPKRPKPWESQWFCRRVVLSAKMLQKRSHFPIQPSNLSNCKGANGETPYSCFAQKCFGFITVATSAKHATLEISGPCAAKNHGRSFSELWWVEICKNPAVCGLRMFRNGLISFLR